MPPLLEKPGTLPSLVQGLLATLSALAAGAVINMAALATMPGLLSLLAGYRYGQRLSACVGGILCRVGVWRIAGLLLGATAEAALIMVPMLLIVTLVAGGGAHASGGRMAAMGR